MVARARPSTASTWTGGGVVQATADPDVEAERLPDPGREPADQTPPPPAGMGPLSRWGWAAVLAVTVLGGLLRFWRLDRPRFLVFDETYYVKQGFAMFRAGHELAWKGEG